jgi:DNA-binding beta-propeller fold protein YncE
MPRSPFPTRRQLPKRWSALTLAALLSCALHSFGEDLLQAGPPVVLEGTHGKFDFLAIDSAGRRLLAAHTGNTSLDVFDLDHQTLIKAVPTGAAQAAVADPAGGRYFVAVSKPPQLVVVDAAKLEPTAKIPLSGPADLLAFNSKSGLVYVDHDDGKDVWVINPAEGKIASTVTLPGDGPEDLGFDGSCGKLFQSLKNQSIVAVVDVATGKVVESWPTAPAAAPHGMAFLPDDHAFLVAGGNGKLVLMSDQDGHVLSSTTIPPRVDQIAYDRGSHRVYCASGTGKIAIVKLEDGKLSTLGEVPSSEGCHSIAVDPKTHQVWVAYAKGDQAFVQSYTPR